MALVTAMLMTIRRTYEAADSVIGAVENVTVQFVHEVGEESIKVVPLLIGVFITLVLLLLGDLHRLVPDEHGDVLRSGDWSWPCRAARRGRPAGRSKRLSWPPTNPSTLC